MLAGPAVVVAVVAGASLEVGSAEVLVAALVAYLGWRLIEVIIWAVTGEWP